MGVLGVGLSQTEPRVWFLKKKKIQICMYICMYMYFCFCQAHRNCVL